MSTFNRHPSNPEYGNDGAVLAATDWRGNRFKVGDTVLYCISAGRGQMMAEGVVVQIRSQRRVNRVRRPARDGETPTYSFTLSSGDVWEGVEEETFYDDITVQVHTRATAGRWDNQARTKPAWVNSMNITALETYPQ